MFTTQIGTPIEPDNVRRSWHPLRTAARFDAVRFHTLSHSCVILLLGLKVPPHIVRDIVGHDNIDVMMTIYAHSSLEQKRAAPRKLEEHLERGLPLQRWLQSAGIGCSQSVDNRWVGGVVRGGLEPPTFRFSDRGTGARASRTPAPQGGRIAYRDRMIASRCCNCCCTTANMFQPSLAW